MLIPRTLMFAMRETMPQSTFGSCCKKTKGVNYAKNSGSGVIGTPR